MKIFVESNFVLELVLEQEQVTSCLELLEKAEAGAVRLIIPAYSMIEPYETLGRRHRDRKRVRADLSSELRQLSRSASAAAYSQASEDVLALLIESANIETQRIAEFRHRLSRVTSVVPLTPQILDAAAYYQALHDLSAQDAVVYASVIADLESDPNEESCFISRNSSDFDDPDIRSELLKFHCKYFARFDVALQYLQRPR